MSVYAVRYDYSEQAAARDEHRPAHRAFLAALADDGALLLSGPFADSPDGALIVLEADDAEAARALLREDPFQQQGLVESVTVREWALVLGSWLPSNPS